MSFFSHPKSPKFFLLAGFIFMSIQGISVAQAETVSGNGYILNQVISPLQGSVSGNGYTAQQTGQVVGNVIVGGGYQSQSVFGTSVTPTEPAPIVSSISSSGGGWGYYVLPVATTSIVATSSVPINSTTILTANGSTCSTRIALASPVVFGLKNDPVDVKKLETFLNTYEGTKLQVNGLYGKEDYLAVKKWQLKYKTNILLPMKLRNPTGTVYTSSMRQIERQTTAACGQQVIVHACPYFRAYVMYGDKGAEVKKIQQFLNIVRGEKLAINGKYDTRTRDAAKRFQRFYRKDIVSIVRLSFITGNWNASTQTKANEVIGCDKLK